MLTINQKDGSLAHEMVSPFQGNSIILADMYNSTLLAGGSSNIADGGGGAAAFVALKGLDDSKIYCHSAILCSASSVLKKLITYAGNMLRSLSSE